MRQGTVLNRFDMFPKPGQTIGSFKEQTRSTPSRPRPGAASQKPAVRPGSRLYSRVEEVTRPAPATSDQPPEKDTPQTRPPEGAIAPEPPSKPAQEPSQSDIPTRAAPESRSADQPDQNVRPKPAPASHATPEARPSAPAERGSQPELPLAIPRRVGTALPELPKAKPVRSSAPSTSGPVVQRQTTKSAVPPPPRTTTTTTTPTQTPVAQPRRSVSPEGQPAESGLSGQSKPQAEPLYLPKAGQLASLAEHLYNRTQTARQLPLAVPKRPASPARRLPVSQPDPLPAARGLTRRPPEQSVPASSGQTKQVRPPSILPPARGLVLPLARTAAPQPARTSAPQSAPTATPQTLNPAVRQQPGQSEPPSPERLSPVAPQVQRIIDPPDVNAPSDPSGAIQQVVQGPSVQAETSSSERNLDQLAEEIYPLVKRLLEIENDRTSAS
jgi:hypothetical protein